MANCPQLVPIKVSQLSRYQNLDKDDFFLTIESGSGGNLYSRRSTFTDLVNALSDLTGSYSGSFSGSFFGRVLSKNANLTGALSGAFSGSILSTKTIASGSFSGSFFGRVLSKNFKASGSLVGTFQGTASGSLSGSYLGKVKSSNLVASGSLSGSYFGSIVSKKFTASGSLSGSYFGSVVSKNLKASGSLSGSLYGRSNFSLSASCLRRMPYNDELKFTYFDGTRLVHDPTFRKRTDNSTYNNYYHSSSIAAQYFIIDSKASNSSSPKGFCESGIIFSNNYNRNGRVNPSFYDWGPEGWRLFATQSGSLNFASLTGSYQFTNQNFTAKGLYAYFSALKTVNNVFYFWPESYSYSSIVRDASVGIGIIPDPDGAKAKQRTKARLHIAVFSSSVANRGTGNWAGSATVRQLDGAIYVEYGSGSLNAPFSRTFYVSGSGNMYTAGNLNVNKGITGSLLGNVTTTKLKASGSLSGSYFGSVISKNSFITGSFRGVDNFTNFKGTGKKVSFYGTASNAITASYALTASYLVPKISANSINRHTVDYNASGYGSLPITVAHNCPSTPFGTVLNWVAKSGGSTPSGFSAGDIISFDDVFYWGNDDDINIQSPGAAVKISGANVTIGWPSYNWTPIGYVFGIVLNGGTRQTFFANQWFLRITYLY